MIIYAEQTTNERNQIQEVAITGRCLTPAANPQYGWSLWSAPTHFVRVLYMDAESKLLEQKKIAHRTHNQAVVHASVCPPVYLVGPLYVPSTGIARI